MSGDKHPVVGLVVPVQADLKAWADERRAKRRAARSLAEHEHNLALAQHQKQVDEAEHAVARAALAWCYEDGSAADLMRELRAACAALADAEKETP